MKNLKKSFLAVLLFFLIGLILPFYSEAAPVKLNKTKMVLYAGNSGALKLTGTSKKAVFRSSKKSVAIVSSKGKVTAKSPGSAIITAKLGSKSYRCKVTVKNPRLNKTKLTLYSGKSYSLKLKGAKAKSFKSSNSRIASVSKKGRITARKAGTATIICRAGTGKAYRCKVVVKKPSLNKTRLTLSAGKTYTLKLTGDAAKRFKSSNSTVASVSRNGKVISKKAGTAIITCTGKSGKAYRCSVTVKGTHSHAHRYTSKVTLKATCSSEGTITYTCSCGDKYTASIPRKEHSYITTVISPACTTPGYTQYTCSICGFSCKDQETPASGHQYTSKIFPPTCTDTGYTQYVCSICGSSHKSQETPALGHDYETRVVPPSKEGPGYTSHVCKVCKSSYEDSPVDFQPTAEQVYADLIANQAAYPEGMAWDNSNYYGWKGGVFSGGYGCAGFAFLLSDSAFGYLPARRHESFSSIQVGDIIRMNGNTHSVIVLELQSNGVIVAEGNFNRSIHWGRYLSFSEIQASGDYILTRYPASR